MTSISLNCGNVSLYLNCKYISELSDKLDDDIVYPVSEMLNGLAQRTCWIRLLAPVMGGFYGGALFLKCISTVFESAIKGLINLSLGIFYLESQQFVDFDSELVIGGTVQIVVGAGLFTILAVPGALILCFIMTAFTFYDPVYATQRQCDHIQFQQLTNSNRPSSRLSLCRA